MRVIIKGLSITQTPLVAVVVLWLERGLKMITEREIVDRLIEYVESCGGDALLALYNQVFGSKDITFNDVEWES